VPELAKHQLVPNQLQVRARVRVGRIGVRVRVRVS
jgi:hypothetical protein